MKNYILLLLLSVFAIATTKADIYTSISKKIEIQKEKKDSVPIKLNWYGKGGVNFGVTTGDSYKIPINIPLKSYTIGLDINAGFYSFFMPSKPSKFYWGVDINVGLNLFHLNEAENVYSDSHFGGVYYCETQNFFMPYLNLAPQVGWTKELSNNTKLDIHLAPVGMYVTSRPKYTCYHEYHNRVNEYEESLFIYPFDGFSKIGVGIWHKNMIYDISYRQPWLYFPGTITFGVGVLF